MKQGGKLIHGDLSYKIVGILYDIYNGLGYGFSEKTYEKAIAKTFLDNGIKFIQQSPYQVIYRGEVISRQFIDFVVEGKIVLELKRGDYFDRKNVEQIKKYLAATDLHLAILAHFTSSGVKIFRAFNPKNIKVNKI